MARHEHAAREAGVTLEALGDQAVLVRGDRLRLEQVLQNLAANALRHTPAGGRVVLGAARRGDAVVLSVQDNGAGIQPEHLPHVFDRFYKADASRAEESGTGSGLGLSIVKAIVERHGGAHHRHAARRASRRCSRSCCPAATSGRRDDRQLSRTTPRPLTSAPGRPTLTRAPRRRGATWPFQPVFAGSSKRTASRSPPSPIARHSPHRKKRPPPTCPAASGPRRSSAWPTANPSWRCCRRNIAWISTPCARPPARGASAWRRRANCPACIPSVKPARWHRSGRSYGQSVYVDEALARNPEITFHAGTHVDAMRIKFADFVALVHPVPARIAVAPPTH